VYTRLVRLKAPKPDKDTLGTASITITSEPKVQTYIPPDDWEVDLDRRETKKPFEALDRAAAAQGLALPSSQAGCRVELDQSVSAIVNQMEAQRDHVRLTGVAEAKYIDNGWPSRDESIDGQIDKIVTLFIRKKTPSVVSNDYDLWLTGRYASTCATQTGAAPSNDSVVLEQPLRRVSDAQIGAPMKIASANGLRAEIGSALLRSVNHPDRRPLGAVRFVEATFLGRSLARLIQNAGHRDNVGARELKNVLPATLAKRTKAAPNITRSQLLAMSVEQQADRFGLTLEESAQLRRAALGLEGPAPESSIRWRRPRPANSSKRG